MNALTFGPLYSFLATKLLVAWVFAGNSISLPKYTELLSALGVLDAAITGGDNETVEAAITAMKPKIEAMVSDVDIYPFPDCSGYAKTVFIRRKNGLNRPGFPKIYTLVPADLVGDPVTTTTTTEEPTTSTEEPTTSTEEPTTTTTTPEE